MNSQEGPDDARSVEDPLRGGYTRTGRSPNKTLSNVICPGVIVSDAHFMKTKLLPQTRPRRTKATVARFLTDRVCHTMRRPLLLDP